MTNHLEQLLRRLGQIERQAGETLTLPAAPALPRPPRPAADGGEAQAAPPAPAGAPPGPAGGGRAPEGEEELLPRGAAREVLEEAAAALPREGSPSPQLSPPAGEGTPPPVARGERGEDAPLLELYRQVRAGEQAPAAPPPAGGGVAVAREELAPRQELTLGRLDRAVRRDSRRYDGGLGAL